MPSSSSLRGKNRSFRNVSSKKGVNADVLNRFFGQKPPEDPKKDQGAAQERAGAASTSEQRLNFLSRTRQMFSRLGQNVQETDTITDDLWDELEESLLAADVGPTTTAWLMTGTSTRLPHSLS